MQACSVFRNLMQIYNTNRLFARTAVDKSIVRMDCCLYFCSILLNMSKIKNAHFSVSDRKKSNFYAQKTSRPTRSLLVFRSYP